ncbi:MAG: hypothetical protein A2044_00900 [Candidatus Firestonebacteria bacterium GWA2_43_8]|nr:MAG: hypothetical protein A2044_00900 [Candidatus Firestonebacteria bacterium GWA2_43_8]
MEKKKILVVDDDREFSAELKEMLEDSGYDALVVNDSNNAVKTARKELPDLILLDMRMNGPSGYQVTLKLKEFPETLKIPIIAMTGKFNAEFFGLNLMYGEEKSLKKPFFPLDLISRIEKNLL